MKTNCTQNQHVSEADDEFDEDFEAHTGFVANMFASVGNLASAISSKSQEGIRNVRPIHGVLAAMLFLTGMMTGTHFESLRHQPDNATIELGQQTKQTEQREIEYTPSPSVSTLRPYTPRKVVFGTLIDEI